LKKIIKQILEVLTKKDKINCIISLAILMIKSVLEVLSIGLIIPILSFTTGQNKSNFLYDFFPFLRKMNDNEFIFFLIFAFVFIYFIKTLFILFSNSWAAKFINNFSVSLTKRVLKKYLNKNYIFFLENNPSFFVRNISSETSLFAGLIGSFIVCITQIIFIILVCSFLIIYNIYSLYVMLFLLSVCGIIIKVTSNRFKKWGAVRLDTDATLLEKINQIIGNIKEVILYNKRQFFVEEVNTQRLKLSNANIYRDTALAFTAPIIEFVGILIFFSFFLFLIVYSAMDMNDVMILFGVFAFVCIKLLPASVALLRSLQAIKFNMPSCGVVHQILTNSEIPDSFYEIEESKKIILDSIKFENVCFFYKNQKNPTLSKLNFEITIGDKIGIIGETGSVKTTLLNIISTLVKPSSGTIKINNSDQLNSTKEIRNSIGYVSQDIYLSDNSILSNISLTNEILPEEEQAIMSILQSLNLNFINNEEVNSFTTTGERGSRLSGGQIQRIGIARAIFRDPRILILDEATNALDTQNETKILDYLFKKFEKKIIIICTHKKELLKYCNKIIEVKNNTINIKNNKIN